MCLNGSYMHCAGRFVQGKKSVFCWHVLTQCQHVIAVQLCSVGTGHVLMFSVEPEFVICKLCSMHCSCTVSMHTVLFYSACWKHHKTGDLSTADTTACTIIFHMGHISVVIPLLLWAFPTWPIVILTSIHWLPVYSPKITNQAPCGEKNCWGAWWVDIAWHAAWHAMACL